MWKVCRCCTLRNMSHISKQEGVWMVQCGGGGPCAKALVKCCDHWPLFRILSKSLGMKLWAPGLCPKARTHPLCLGYVTCTDACEVTLSGTLQERNAGTIRIFQTWPLMGSFTKETVTSTTNVPGDPRMDCVEELYYLPRRTRSKSPNLYSQTLTCPPLPVQHWPLSTSFPSSKDWLVGCTSDDCNLW